MKSPPQPPKRPAKKGLAPPIVGLLLAPGARWVTIPVVVTALIAAGCYLRWQKMRDKIVADPTYRVTRESIEMTPLPPWIHTDIAEEVLRGLQLNTVASLVDDGLSEHLAKAFELHPWIARVIRVEKQYPAHVVVQVEYRRPVAMVEVPLADGELPLDQAPMTPADEQAGHALGVYPVDVTGVLLPTADFSRAEARHYPRLASIHSLPVGSVGTQWGDPRVTGGAEIAAILLADWEKLHLQQIIPSEQPQSGGSSDDYSYEILARDGTRILWGQRPTSQFGSEVSAAEKVERMRNHLTHADEAGTDTSPMELDIRYSQGVHATRRTARVPK